MNDEEIDSILANFMHDIEVFGSEVVGTPTDADMKRLEGIYEEHRNEIKSRDQQIALTAEESAFDHAKKLLELFPDNPMYVATQLTSQAMRVRVALRQADSEQNQKEK